MLRGMAIRMKEWGMQAYPRQRVLLTTNSLNDWGRSGQALGRGVAAAGQEAAGLAEAMRCVQQTGNEADIAGRLEQIGRETAEELRDKPVRDWDYSWQQAYEPRLRQMLAELEDDDTRAQARELGSRYSSLQSLQARRATELERIRHSRQKWSMQVEAAVQRGDAESATRWLEQGRRVFVPESELPQQREAVQSRSLCARWQQQVEQDPAAALAAWAAPDAARPTRREDLQQVQSRMAAARSTLHASLAAQLAAALEQGCEPDSAVLQQAAAAGVLPAETLAAASQQVQRPLAVADTCRWLRRIDEREPGADDRLVVEIALAPLPLPERRLLLQRVQATAEIAPQQRAGVSRSLWAMYHEGRFGCPGDAAALRCLGRLQDEALQHQQAAAGDEKAVQRWLEQLRRCEEPWLCFE